MTDGDAFVQETLHAAIRRIVREFEAAGCGLPPLPSGWTRDETRGSFFHEHDPQCSTTLDPRFLPAQWEMRLDLDSKPYFASHAMKLTTFIDPRGLPVNWRMLVEDATGKVYFANDALHYTTYTDPRGLPDGVELRIADDAMYFVDHVSKTTGWEDPRACPELAASYRADLERDMRSYLQRSLAPPPGGLERRLSPAVRPLSSAPPPAADAPAGTLHAPPYMLAQIEQRMEGLSTADAPAGGGAAQGAGEAAVAAAAAAATAAAAAAAAASEVAAGEAAAGEAAAAAQYERTTSRRDGVPPQFFCPITLAVMRDPVITADGQTYERRAIEQWLRGKATSPLTGKALPHFELAPNVVLRSLIGDFFQAQGAEPPPAEALPVAALASQ